MTNTTDAQAPETGMDDPRVGFAVVTETVGELMNQVEADQLSLPTPCSEFDVKDLLDHMVMVMQRVVVLGKGQHFSEANEQTAARDSGHGETFQGEAHVANRIWADPAKLDAMYEVPWGEIPGGPMLYTYTAELATHGWDLATAIGRELTIDDEHLGGAFVAIRMIPEEGRGGPEVPFDPVVHPGDDAPLLLKIAGWGGRRVI